MGWNGVSPSCLIFGLCIGWCFIATLHAQYNADPCIQGGNYDISFPEESTGNPQKVSGMDQSYVIEVRNDTTALSNKYQFRDYFVVGYNPVQRFQYISMIKPIDRDGPTSSLDDDVNILQYQLICTPPGGSATKYSIFKIQITDINDNVPVFVRPPYNTSISELTPVGQIFYRDIYAEDKDEGQNKQLQYSLSDIPGAMFPGVNYFTIAVVGEGLVAVNRGLDFERMYRATGNRADLCYYNMTVTSWDQGTIPRSATTSFLIYIEDDDDLGPEYVYPTCVSSTEPYGQSCIRARYLTNLQPSSSQTLVFTPYPADTNNPSATVDIIAQDRDTLNSPIIFAIARTLPSGLEGYFSVSAVQIGQTKQYRCVVTYSPVNNVYLNRNNVQSLDIIIQAIENTFNRRLETATITVNLVQTNTGPPVITPSSATGYIYENSPNGTLVSQDRATTTALRLTFSDPDLSPSDPVPQYNIQVSGGPFTVTSAGYVQLQMGVLDYEQTPQYTLAVTITDPASPADKATGTYTITVLDVNDLYPIFTGNYDVTIQEGSYTQTPQVLVTVAATDGDFGPVTYSKISVSPAGSDSKFSVVTNTGAVSLQGTVQAYEVYFINIRATDSGTPQRSTDTVVVVRVTPLGNQKPSFSASRYIIYVSEDVPLNTALFLLQATDQDTDRSLLTYAVTSEVPATGSFFVNSISLKNSRTFDRELIAEYNVTVTVSDPQGNSGSTIVTVVILDVNDNSPQFTMNEYTFQIPEGPRTDPFIGSVSANDRDAPGTGSSAVSYSIFSQLNSCDFTIDQTTGRISSTRSFNYEVQKRYQIVVRATDAGTSPRYSVVIVNVDILDIQDEVPLFETTNAEVTVREDVSLNVPILRLPVSDADAIKNITVKLTNTNGSPLTTPFSVQLDNNSAAISVTTKLNNKDKQLYTFIVTTEQGQGSNIPLTSVAVTVHVTGSCS